MTHRQVTEGNHFRYTGYGPPKKMPQELSIAYSLLEEERKRKLSSQLDESQIQDSSAPYEKIRTPIWGLYGQISVVIQYLPGQKIRGIPITNNKSLSHIEYNNQGFLINQLKSKAHGKEITHIVKSFDELTELPELDTEAIVELKAIREGFISARKNIEQFLRHELPL